ncbi:small integral membrane protein 12-like [Eptesicus fuscus]|uniref:small integral membrane protein 12-like n=1 Tax=Eptesicus fuscus TaxID=29078 RepID=UPI002403AC95|nr:small integral membrane protein 12-like [Eptesicus fuscus]
MWPVFWTVVRTYAPYVTFPVAFVVGTVGYHLEWVIRGKDPQPVEEEKSISERREDRKLDELLGKDHTQVVSLKDKLVFAPKAVLNRNCPEKNEWRTQGHNVKLNEKIPLTSPQPMATSAILVARGERTRAVSLRPERWSLREHMPIIH